jgi:hypothetical protein
MYLHRWPMLFTEGVMTVTSEYLRRVVKFCYRLSVWCIFSLTLDTINYSHRLVQLCIVNRRALRVSWHVTGIKLELGVVRHVKHVSPKVLFQKSKPSILMRKRILNVTVM